MEKAKLRYRAQKRVAFVFGAFACLVFILRIANLIVSKASFLQFLQFKEWSILVVSLLFFVSASRNHWVFRALQLVNLLLVVCLLIVLNNDLNLNIITVVSFIWLMAVQYGFLSKPFQILKTALVVGCSVVVPLLAAVLIDAFVFVNFLAILAGFGVSFGFVWIAFFDEINHYRERTEALEDKLSANWAFVKFGRNVSGVVHNLRSKLNSILGFNELISAQAQDVNLEYVSLQKKSCEEMLDMIDSLLFMVKSSRKPDPELVSLADMVKGVITVFQVDANLRARMKTSVKVKDSSMVFAPPSQIVQVLENVIGNAFAAMQDNSLMELSCEITRKDEMVWLSIRDNGKGMETCKDCKHKSCLNCEKFAIGKSGKNEGHGIGIIYVQETMAGLKGGFMIDSVLGQYTVVNLGFPINADLMKNS